MAIIAPPWCHGANRILPANVLYRNHFLRLGVSIVVKLPHTVHIVLVSWALGGEKVGDGLGQFPGRSASDALAV
jgi:hypothetical protein